MDLTKAFVRVNFWKLFNQLLCEGADMCLVRLLAYWYVNHAYGTVCQHSFAMMTYRTVLLGDNSRRIGFNLAAEAQCELLP